MRPPRYFTPTTATPVDRVRSALATGPEWETADSATERVEVLDTFDWRAFRKGGVIEHAHSSAGDTIVWRDLATGEELPERSRSVPTFAKDLPHGRLREQLTPLLGVRALLAHAELEVHRESYRRTDAESKTVARLSLEHRRLLNGSQSPRDVGWLIRVEPLRGYDAAAAATESWLMALGLVELDTDPSLAALVANGVEPGAYSSHLRLDFARGTLAGEGFRIALLHFLDTIELNVDGTVRDLDPEFLHDLRVAVRRSRSILSRSRGVLPDEVINRFADDLRWLGRSTTPARDIDVWCLSWGSLLDRVPERERSALAPLRGHLWERRKTAHAALNEVLGSERFRNFVDSWRAALNASPAELPAEAELQLGAVAAQRVERALRSVLKHGGRIDESSPPEALHDLRKRAKRLRYLLECFSTALRDEAALRLVPELKRLQDVLGDFQDAEVQAESLRGFARAMQRDHATPADTLVAIGVLVARLDDRQQRARRRYAERFDAFDSIARAVPIR